HDGRREDSHQEDEIKAGRLDLNRTFESSFVKDVGVGANFNRRTKDKSALVYFADLPNGRTPTLVAPGNLMSPTQLGFLGMRGIFSYDPYALINAGYYDVTPSPSVDDLRKNYGVSEDVGTYYAKVDFDIAATDRVTFRGNIGVQYIRTDQSSTGMNVIPD